MMKSTQHAHKPLMNSIVARDLWFSIGCSARTYDMMRYCKRHDSWVHLYRADAIELLLPAIIYICLNYI